MDIEKVMRYRVRFMGALGVLLFVLSKPRSAPLFASGFALGLAGAALRLWAAGQLEKGGRLVTDGPDWTLRHPLDAGSGLMALGACVAATGAAHPASSLLVWLALGGAFAGVYGEKIRREESELTAGAPEFAAYRDRVPALVPARGSLAAALASTRFDAARALSNREHLTAAGFLLVSALLRLKQVYRW